MATYKTEFLAQRYRRRVRPAAHYSMGALPRWLRLVGALPAPVVDALNAAARGPLAGVAKRAGGIAPRRAIPPLARRPFTARGGFAAGCPAPIQSRQGDPAPITPRAPRPAAAVARHVHQPLRPRRSPPPRSRCWRRSGTPSSCPTAPVCCGLTWTSTGQVGAARRVLRRSLRRIAPWLAAGVPVVGLEPSCTAALRADAAELLPDEPLATAVAAGVRTFAEVLAEHADELSAAVVAPGQRALVQVHCHQHADLGIDADRAVLAALGVDAEVLDSGCCGLAGNFGFEQGHYEVSMACAERVLLPAVRAADADVAVLADGFSCRTQLRQAGQREPVHLAQLAARALGIDQ